MIYTKKTLAYLSKHIKQISLLFFLLFANYMFCQNATIVASCCSSGKGKCTGSAYCTACRDCSRCGHCNSGGSCGVCSGKKTNRTYNYYPSNSKPTETYIEGVYSLPDDYQSQYYLKTIVVNSETLNLRKGPGTTYDIIQELAMNQELIFLAMIDEWVKVKVKSNNIVGFVHYKYVLVK